MTQRESARRLLVTGFRPGAGGVSRVMLNLIEGFARAGVDVHLLIGEGDHPALAKPLPGVQVHREPLKPARVALPRVHRLLEALAPSVVLSNRDDASILVIAAREGLASSPRVIPRIGIHVPTKLRSKNPFAGWRRRRQLQRAYRASDLLLANSRGVAQGLDDLLGSSSPPVEILNNPVDLERCRRMAAEAPAHPWCRERSGRLLVTVGRLVRMKDHETLLRALALLPSDVRLVIFGEGRQRRRLAALAKRLGITDRLDLPGFSDNPFADVARADAFVLSSRFEGSPNALLEAIAVGTPAVATDCPSGPREILEDGRYGLLVPMGDPRALADAVLATLNDPPSSEALAEAADRYAIDHAVQAYLRAMGFCEHEPPLPSA